MRLPSVAAAGLLALVNLAAAATTVTLYLPGTPAPLTLSPRTHATLTALGRRFSAPVSDAHTFVFRNVTAGSYLVDVHCPTDGFAPLRIDVGDDETVQAWETFRGNDWANKGEALALRRGSDGSAGFEVRSLGRKGYFMERPKCRSFCQARRTRRRVDDSLLTVHGSLDYEHPDESHDSDGSGVHGHLHRHAQACREQYVQPNAAKSFFFGR